MDAVNQTVKRVVSEFGRDADLRNRVLGTVLVLTLLVGAFASGLEISVRFGATAEAETAQAVRPGPVAATSPSASGGGPTPPPRPVPARGPGSPSPAPMPAPAPSPAPAPGLDTPPTPRSPATDPVGGPAPALPPAHVPESDDDNDDECVVTETLLLIPVDEELEESCAEVTGEIDALLPHDDEEPLSASASSGSTRAVPDPGADQRRPVALSVLWRLWRA